MAQTSTYATRPMIELSDLLTSASLGADETKVLIMRHAPDAKELSRFLPIFAHEEPDVYNAYQAKHEKRPESALKNATHLVSCVPDGTGRALFVGVYAVKGFKPVSPDEFIALPTTQRLTDLGTRPIQREDAVLFDLELTNHLAELKGKLVFEFVGRTYYQWAEQGAYKVLSISDESKLVKALPDWREIVVSWAELQSLPRSWKEALRQWRGVYYIVDTEKNLSYVGSASGGENIWRRWENYRDTGHGGNKYLKTCNRDKLRFSILERTSPDMPPKEVNAVENQWKERLHTRHPHGLNDN